MTDRPIAPVSAQFSDTSELVAAIRQLREKRNVSCERLDDICGFPKGYTQKLLSDPPVKNLGPISMFPLIGGLGLALVLVDDPDALRRVASRLVQRNKSQVRIGGAHSAVTFKLSRRHMRKIAKLATAARAKKIPRWRRIQLAKRAARARWKRERAKSVPAPSERQGTSLGSKRRRTIRRSSLATGSGGPLAA